MLPRSGDYLKDVVFGVDAIRPGHTQRNREGRIEVAC